MRQRRELLQARCVQHGAGTKDSAGGIAAQTLRFKGEDVYRIADNEKNSHKSGLGDAANDLRECAHIPADKIKT